MESCVSLLNRFVAIGNIMMDIEEIGLVPGVIIQVEERWISHYAIITILKQNASASRHNGLKDFFL
jgi:hypothetical protein